VVSSVLGRARRMTTLVLAARIVPRSSRSSPPRSRALPRRSASREMRSRHVTSASDDSESSGWWASPFFSALLPSRTREAAREIEYFGGSPLQQVIPWISGPRADAPGRPFVDDPANQLVLFDFSANSPDADPDSFKKTWGALNDVVMGGRSEASVSLVKLPENQGGSCAKLAGVVEGAGGGFVSMRSRNFQRALDLSGYDGLRASLRGDGRRYKLIVRDVEDFFGLAFHAAFDTVENEWITVDVPFRKFVPVARADIVRPGSSEYRSLRADRVKSVQIMFSKYELGMGELNPTFASGPFFLEVSAIRAYKDRDDRGGKKSLGISDAGSRDDGTKGSAVR